MGTIKTDWFRSDDARIDALDRLLEQRAAPFGGLGLEPLDGYLTARIAASWRWTERIRLFGRVENLTDERYEEIYRFGTVGRTVHAGITAAF